MYLKVSKRGRLNVHAEAEDLCYACTHTKSCPLVSALSAEVAILRYESVEIKECAFAQEAQ